MYQRRMTAGESALLLNEVPVVSRIIVVIWDKYVLEYTIPQKERGNFSTFRVCLDAKR